MKVTLISSNDSSSVVLLALISSEISNFSLLASKTFVGRVIHEVMTIRKP